MFFFLFERRIDYTELGRDFFFFLGFTLLCGKKISWVFLGSIGLLMYENFDGCF